MSSQASGNPPPDEGGSVPRVAWVGAGLSFLTLLALTLFARPVLEAMGNVASVWGFWVSVVGFGFTLWTVYETKRITRAARQETRENVERIALQLLQGDCEAVVRVLVDGLDAVPARNWGRVLDKFREAQRLFTRVRQFDQLQDVEKDAFRTGVENLSAAMRHLHTKVLPDDVSEPLSEEKTKALRKHLTTLERLAVQVENAAARLRHLVWRVRHVS